MLGSDHRPVFSSFNVGVTSDFVMNRNSLSSESLIKIVFYQVVAQVRNDATLIQISEIEFKSSFKYSGSLTTTHWIFHLNMHTSEMVIYGALSLSFSLSHLFSKIT